MESDRSGFGIRLPFIRGYCADRIVLKTKWSIIFVPGRIISYRGGATEGVEEGGSRDERDTIACQLREPEER